jgi:hypothetical protein
MPPGDPSGETVRSGQYRDALVFPRNPYRRPATLKGNETSAPKPLYTVKWSDDAKIAGSAIGLGREWEE